MNRLTKIFGSDGTNWENVKSYFVIVSPKEPQKLNYQFFPGWAMKNNQVSWIPLDISEKLKKVVRCDQNRNPDKSGRYWMVKPGEY